MLNNDKGFTLIEAIVAIALLVIMMLGALNGLISSYDLTARNAIRDEAVSLCAEKLNSARNTSYSSLSVGTTTSTVSRQISEGDIAFSVQQVVAVEVTNVAKSVQITVSWPYKGNTYNYVATTIVGNK